MFSFSFCFCYCYCWCWQWAIYCYVYFTAPALFVHALLEASKSGFKLHVAHSIFPISPSAHYQNLKLGFILNYLTTHTIQLLQPIFWNPKVSQRTWPTTSRGVTISCRPTMRYDFHSWNLDASSVQIRLFGKTISVVVQKIEMFNLDWFTVVQNFYERYNQELSCDDIPYQTLCY